MAKAHCLIVDDSRVVTEALQDYLRDMGHDVRCAGDGETALAMLAEEDRKVDLVFLDVHLPGMDGVQILGRIRARWPKLRVVIMTSDRDAETFDEVEEADGKVEGFLHKPFDRDVLEICLDTVWNKGGRFRHKKPDPFA